MRTTNHKGRGLSVEEVIDHGTPIQKAYKAIMECVDRDMWVDPDQREPQRITRGEGEKILASMSPKERVIHDVYYCYYLTYVETTPQLSFVNASREKSAQVLLSAYNSITTEENLLTQIYNTLPENHRGVFLNTIHKRLDLVLRLDGTVRILYDEKNLPLWRTVLRANEILESECQDLKNLITALEQFDKKYYEDNRTSIESGSLKLFVPRYVKWLIDRAKGDYVGSFEPMLSMKEYRTKVEKNEVIPHGKIRAIVKEYDEIETDEREVESWVQEVKHYWEIANHEILEY